MFLFIYLYLYISCFINEHFIRYDEYYETQEVDAQDGAEVERLKKEDSLKELVHKTHEGLEKKDNTHQEIEIEVAEVKEAKKEGVDNNEVKKDEINKTDNNDASKSG